MPNDFQLDCTWEDVENSAKQPNVFVTMSEYHDPDIGDITVADKSGAAIFGLLQSNPKQQIVFTDLSGRQCIMTAPPTSGVSEVRFSVLVGTMLYIYRMPDGNARVYTDTIDISSSDSGTFVVRFTMTDYVISADQTYADVMAAAANGKVVIGRYGANDYYFTGDPDDDGATFVRPFFNNNAQSLQQIILADDESVTISTRQLASNAVLYTQQTLTNQQKAQARANIGATDGASGISDTIKQELLNCFAHVAWADEHGQDYYDALEAALYTKTVESISAVFNQGSAVVYDTDSLDTLRQYLTVTATYDDTSTAVVTAYTLSGTLTVGTSTITVSYEGKTTTISVAVSSSYTVGYQAIGSPTISDNILTVENGKFIRSTVALSPSSGQTWKVRLKMKYSSLPSNFVNVVGGAESDGTFAKTFIVQNNSGAKQFIAYVSADMSNWTESNIYHSGYLTPSTGTWYYYEFGYTGTAYFEKIYSGGWDGTLLQSATKTSAATIYNGKYVGFGVKSSVSGFSGQIDLTECSIYVGDTMIWKAA